MAKEINTTSYHPLSGKRVVVTGATGMLGGELVRRLAKTEALIRVVVRDASRLAFLFDNWENKPELEMVECELINPIELAEAFSGADVVFHCAAQVSFHPDSDRDLVHTNTAIVHHVVNACLDAGVGRLVHVSSIAALGGTNADGMTDERCYPDSLEGWNDYALSKFYSENEVWRGIRQGLDAVIVNPSVIFGRGDWKGRGSAALFAALSSGTPFYVPGTNGYVDVRDVAGAMILLASSPEAKGKRFVLNGANLTYKELITLAAESIGRRKPRYRLGEKGLKRTQRFASGIARLTRTRPMLTDDLVKAALAENRYDGTAVQQVIDFEYRPIGQTIQYMASVYLQDRKKSKNKKRGS